jgi:hypothetical protein
VTISTGALASGALPSSAETNPGVLNGSSATLYYSVLSISGADAKGGSERTERESSGVANAGGVDARTWISPKSWRVPARARGEPDVSAHHTAD